MLLGKCDCTTAPLGYKADKILYDWMSSRWDHVLICTHSPGESSWPRRCCWWWWCWDLPWSRCFSVGLRHTQEQWTRQSPKQMDVQRVLMNTHPFNQNILRCPLQRPFPQATYTVGRAGVLLITLTKAWEEHLADVARHKVACSGSRCFVSSRIRGGGAVATSWSGLSSFKFNAAAVNHGLTFTACVWEKQRQMCFDPTAG